MFPCASRPISLLSALSQISLSGPARRVSIVSFFPCAVYICAAVWCEVKRCCASRYFAALWRNLVPCVFLDRRFYRCCK